VKPVMRCHHFTGKHLQVGWRQPIDAVTPQYLCGANAAEI
jgi:hypothetical protein